MKALVAIKKDKTFDTFFTQENIEFAESLGEIAAKTVAYLTWLCFFVGHQ